MRYEDMKPEDFYEVPDEKMIVVTSWSEVPQFANEAEAAAFWDTHTLADHLWSKKRGPSAAARQYLERHPEARRPSKIA